MPCERFRQPLCIAAFAGNIYCRALRHCKRKSTMTSSNRRSRNQAQNGNPARQTGDMAIYRQLRRLLRYSRVADRTPQAGVSVYLSQPQHHAGPDSVVVLVIVEEVQQPSVQITVPLSYVHIPDRIASRLSPDRQCHVVDPFMDGCSGRVSVKLNFCPYCRPPAITQGRISGV